MLPRSMASAGRSIIRHGGEPRDRNMNISPRAIIRIGLAAAVMLAAILFVHLRNANGASPPSDSASAGHRLAQAWCKD